MIICDLSRSSARGDPATRSHWVSPFITGQVASVLTVGSLFSGIGGLELGLERAGMRTVWQCERDAFCRRVLARHWPAVHCYSDVAAIDATAPHVDLICGGFPCQPFSIAGDQRGKNDDRYLWPEFRRIIEAVRPSWVVAENVPGIVRVALRDVLADLAGLGFDAEWETIPASAFGAPHRRDRVFIVAWSTVDSASEPGVGWLSRAIVQSMAPGVGGTSAAAGDAADADGEYPRPAPAEQTMVDQHHGGKPAASCDDADADPLRRLEQARRIAIERGWAERVGWVVDPVAGVDAGVSPRLDRPRHTTKRRRALGNAVVVQVAEAIGRAICALP
jgi:DNA (cytosine-5)-methyltransferase 1